MHNSIKSLFNILYNIPTTRKLIIFLNDYKYQFDLQFEFEDLTKNNYQKVKKSSDRELEHQFGRLTNFKSIISSISELDGDCIEFGSWKGFSLAWIGYLLQKNMILDKRVLGIDGFIGLPYSDGIFKKGDFSNASLAGTRKNISACSKLWPQTKKNVIVEKYLFNQKSEMEIYLKRNNFDKFCFVHIDCDVSESFLEIAKFLGDGKYFADECYVLFDDYGCESNLSKLVDTYMKTLKKKWIVKKHSSTELTMNYHLKRKDK